jgi:type II secretory pathway pseudopilin PulG
MTMNRMNHNASSRHAAGFTLVEVLVCCTLVVVAFAALLSAMGQDSRASLAGDRITTATYLADEVRDAVQQMSFANVLTLDGTTLNPAQLSTGAAFSQANWSQTIAVTPMDDTDLNHTIGVGAAHAARITVTVKLNSQVVVTQTYYVMDQGAVPFTTRGN